MQNGVCRAIHYAEWGVLSYTLCRMGCVELYIMQNGVC